MRKSYRIKNIMTGKYILWHRVYNAVMKPPEVASKSIASVYTEKDGNALVNKLNAKFEFVMYKIEMV